MKRTEAGISGTRLRVAVLISHRPNSPGEVGGLAGTWERLSREALGLSGVDITLFFLGDSPGTVKMGENVRYVLLRPFLGTERFRFMRGIPTNTDLAPVHPALFRCLRGYHVIHTSDAFFSFAKTALLRARLSGTPLVTSFQTDVIAWSKVYTPVIMENLMGRKFANWMLEKYRLLDRQQRSLEKRFGRYLRACSAVFVSHDRDRERARRLSPGTPRFLFRRGIDTGVFNPIKRDRVLLKKRYSVPPERTLCVFVGRIDSVKGALFAARVVKRLIEAGRDVHLVVAGEGSQREDVAGLLGERVTLTGNLAQEELGLIYASGDFALFPSEDEVWPNVVVEARSSGIPVVACEQGARHVMEGGGSDGLLIPGREIEEWTAKVETLLRQPARLKEMGRRARESVEARSPSWRQVLEEDLLPVWRKAAGRENP
jgi:glycosyltransferase involved in cell wall biosynthesis